VKLKYGIQKITSGKPTLDSSHVVYLHFSEGYKLKIIYNNIYVLELYHHEIRSSIQMTDGVVNLDIGSWDRLVETAKLVSHRVKELQFLGTIPV